MFGELSGRLAKAAKMFGSLFQSIFINESLSVETRQQQYMVCVCTMSAWFTYMYKHTHNHTHNHTITTTNFTLIITPSVHIYTTPSPRSPVITHWLLKVQLCTYLQSIKVYTSSLRTELLELQNSLQLASHEAGIDSGRYFVVFEVKLIF